MTLSRSVLALDQSSSVNFFDTLGAFDGFVVGSAESCW